MIDRVRAQFVGCSEFMNKSVNSEKIEAIFDKYLYLTQKQTFQ